MGALPNLILIGAQKSGTTSFFGWLAQHPEVYGFQAMKDFNFFADDFYYFDAGIDWFRKQFFPKYGEKVILHGYVNYMYFYEKTLERLLNFKDKYVKELKLLAILRNPVDRAYSAFWDAKKEGLEEAISFEEALKREKKILEKGSFKERASLTYLDHGFYSKQLEGFLKYFGNDLKIIIFEEMIKDPENVMKDVLSWLKLQKGFKFTFDKRNESGLPRYLFIQKLVQRLSYPRVIKKMLPVRLRGNLKWKILREWNVKKYKYPPMLEDTRNYLIDVYREDVRKLESLLGRDLSVWGI